MSRQRPLLSSLTLAILNPDRHFDYLWLGLVCALPSVLAVYLGIGDSIDANGATYIGWFDKYNFWPFVVVQPLTLWIMRQSFKRIANITPTELPNPPPPLITLFHGTEAKQAAYQLMRDWISSPKLLGGALIVSVLIQVADLSELVRVYLGMTEARQTELDWSVMYQIGVISKEANILFNITAYITQFTITTMGIWGMAFLVSHNLFFLDRIYQRSQVPDDRISEYITLDLDDVNRCFGFRAANDGFNTQVIALTIAGVVILMSRFANVTEVNETVLITQLIDNPDVTFFPDIGQILLGIGWVLALFIVSAPALVKLKPRLPYLGNLSELSIDTYLREFLTDDQWTYGDRASEQQISYVAAKFARNGFWPTGDNRASQLFFFSFWVFLIILYPIKTDDTLVLVASFTILGVIAYGLRTIVLKLIDSSLAYVDERLTKEQPELLAQAEPTKPRIRSKVFLSYRREDSLAYARLLRRSLVEYIDADSLFMDLDTIEDGDDFIDAIEAAIRNCEAVIVVIGPTWSKVTDSNGLRRLEKGDDFVRLEIAIAFQENKLVLPVLVGGASMPGESELPADISPLWRRHARELSDSRWDYDVGQLAAAIAARGES